MLDQAPTVKGCELFIQLGPLHYSMIMTYIYTLNVGPHLTDSSCRGVIVA